MRLVFYTDNFPFPLTEGGKVAQFFVLQELARENDVHLISTIHQSGVQHAVELQKLCPQISVHTVMKQEMKEPQDFATKVKRKIIWETRKRMPEYGKSTPMTQHPYFTDPVPLRPQEEAIEIGALIESLQPDILQIDFTESADVALLAGKNIKKVLVIHDLKFAGILQAAVLEKTPPAYMHYLKQYVQEKENAFYRSFDRLIVFSTEDREKLLEQGITNISVSPFAINTHADVPMTGHAPVKLVFLGSDSHTPNLEALRWFAPIAEELQAKKGLTLHVIGNWTESSKLLFKPFTSIRFTGFADRLQESVKDSIMIVPLQMGSGIRTKILDAFVLGVPVVSTALGAEGIGAQDGLHYLQAETKEDFIRQIDHLQQHPEESKVLTNNAKLFVSDNFSPAKVAEVRLDIYHKLLGG